MGSDSESPGSHQRKRDKFKTNRTDNIDSDKESCLYGPVLPSNIDGTQEILKHSDRLIGPSLPSCLKPQESLVDLPEDMFGPALPPHLIKQRQAENSNIQNNLALDKKDIDSNDEDEDIIGPLPLDHPETQNNYAQQKLEERAWRIKHDFLHRDSTKEKKREEWMMELPPTHSANSILGPRKFKLRPGPEMSDRSCWTDTPADRARKEREMMDKRSFEKDKKKKEKDRETEKRKHESKEKSKEKEKSLLEMHQEKLKKKRKKDEKEAKESGRSVRRPFDRDMDLQINGLNQAQKRSIIMKSSQLDDRFHRGKK